DQWAHTDEPAAGLLALHYPIRPTPVAELAAAFARSAVRPLPADSPVQASVLLAEPGCVVRVFQHAGTDDDVVDYLATLPAALGADTWLARANPPTDVRTLIARHRMTCVSHLSAAATG